jgi:hypothetical protein
MIPATIYVPAIRLPSKYISQKTFRLLTQCDLSHRLRGCNPRINEDCTNIYPHEVRITFLYTQRVSVVEPDCLSPCLSPVEEPPVEIFTSSGTVKLACLLPRSVVLPCKHSSITIVWPLRTVPPTSGLARQVLLFPSWLNDVTDF